MAVDAQTEWAHRLIASLVEAGVRQAVISPGSRSTPLTWAARHTPGLYCRLLIDERSAGFFALGQVRLTGMPSLLICTSGTAVANYYPAVIEAAQSQLPLIVLSADRPFELQNCGAQQTIDQTRIFGDFAAFYELGTPSAEVGALRALRRTVRQAVERALSARPGPVQLNFRAQKPLEPRAEGSLVALPEAPGAALVRRPRRAPLAADVEELAAALAASRFPLVLAGAMALHEAPPSAVLEAFLVRSGAVLVPEATSQLRFAAPRELPEAALCDAFDWLVSDPQYSQRLAPDFVLQLGDAPLSTALQAFLEARGDALPHVVCAAEGWPDPAHRSARVVRADAAELLASLSERLAEPRERGAEHAWLARVNHSAWQVVEAELSDGFDEAVAVRALCDALPAGSVLAVGNSLPPRHLDRYCRARSRGIRVCSQRGVAGIEGGFAGAFGAATLAQGATTLLLGDVAALHDVGSLWAADSARTLGPPYAHPIVLVVLNNGGGRIFEQLPLARQGFAPLDFWTSPHRVSFEPAAALYGLHYARARSRAELASALEAAYARPVTTLLEIEVAADNALRTQERIQAALRARLPAQMAELA